MAEEVFGTIQLAELRMWEVPSPLLTEAKLAGGITPSRYLAIHLPALFAIPPQRTAVRLTVNDPAADEKNALSPCAAYRGGQFIAPPGLDTCPVDRAKRN